LDSAGQNLERAAPPEIPPRSRLFNLEPIGLGTPYVESFSGYVSRLAEAHHTTLYYLFSKEVAPLINKPVTIGDQVCFGKIAKATNGLGITASDLVRVFENLTCRNDLRYTTMLPWSGLISSKCLTRKYRPWCPSCYEDSVINKDDVYDQLLWIIQSVNVCDRHKTWLEHECPHCGRQQRVLSHRIRPGFCGRCQSWLGKRATNTPRTRQPGAAEIIEVELRITAEVGKLLALALKLEPLKMREVFQERLLTFAGGLFTGRGVPSRLEFPIDKQAIYCWLHGTQTPSLPLLLKTCLALQVSPATLYSCNGDGEIGQLSARNVGSGNRYIEKTDNSTITLPIDWKDPKSVAYVERRLNAALNEYPPSSLNKIAKELKCTKGTLKKKFPELAARIAEKSLDYYRPSVNRERMLQVMRAALKQSPPPPLEEISRRLGAGASATALHKWFPRESRRIVERFRSYNKRRLDEEVIENQLRAALKRAPPPTMPEISLEIGIACATLCRKFPKLYRALSKRSAAYRQRMSERRKRTLRAEIKSICKRLLMEGTYPSVALVRPQLSVPCRSDAFSKLRREVLAELSAFLCRQF
jgi:hypothetical protein